MGARAITIMIGSILGARQYVMAPNLTKCWDTTKPSVLLNSDNQKDVTTGNQQERLALQESSESICQTRKVKMYSNLMREHERLAEMTSPSNINDRILCREGNPQRPVQQYHRLECNRGYALLYNFPGSRDHLHNPACV